MKSASNLLLEYLDGNLSLEKARAAGSQADRKARELLHLAEFDAACRQLVAGVEPPSGAAERLAELVSAPQTYGKSETSERSGRFLRGKLNALFFDVAGAQYTPKEEVEKKEKSEPRRRKKNVAAKKIRSGSPKSDS